LKLIRLFQSKFILQDWIPETDGPGKQLFKPERKKRSPESKSDQSKTETKSGGKKNLSNVSVIVNGVQRKGKLVKKAGSVVSNYVVV
jgi:hypothetical protein